MIPLIGAFYLGFVTGRLIYRGVREYLFFAGPLGRLRLELIQSQRSPRFRFEPADTAVPLAAGLLCLILLAREQRRTSPSRSLQQGRLYVFGLLAFAASCFVAASSGSALPTALSQVLLVAAALAFLGTSWPRWGYKTRMQAAALFVGAAAFSFVLAQQVDRLVLKDWVPRTHDFSEPQNNQMQRTKPAQAMELRR